MIYIAGKYTGLPHEVAKSAFETTRDNLVLIGVPYDEIIVPTDIVPKGTSWHEAMYEYCFPALIRCTAIFMMKGYADSKGALQELEKARQFRMDIFYEQRDGYDMLQNLVPLLYPIPIHVERHNSKKAGVLNQ